MPAESACSSCQEQLPAGARFCPNCGVAAFAELAYTHVEPRLFGALPPITTLLVGIALFLGGLVMLVLGSLVAGAVLLVLGIGGIALFAEASRRRPRGRLERAASAGLRRMRARTLFLFGSADAWSRAGREVVRLRVELRRLGQTRERTQYEFGGAVYEDDGDRIGALREQLRELEERAGECARAIELATARARERVARDRRTIQPTEVVPGDRPR